MFLKVCDDEVDDVDIDLNDCLIVVGLDHVVLLRCCDQC